MKDEADPRVMAISMAQLYPLYLAKVVRKGRTAQELDEVLRWFTGYTQKQLESHVAKGTELGNFLAKAKLHPNRFLITGVICGVRVEELKHPFMQAVRQMDKVVDELAKGRALAKILRQAP